MRSRNIPAVPNVRLESPEFKANWLSKLTFAWLGSLLSVGRKRPLEKNDLWTINRTRAVGPHVDILQAAFASNIKRGQTNPLLWALHTAFWREFYLGAAFQLVSNVAFALSPYVLQRLLSALTSSTYKENHPYHYGLVTLIAALVLLQTFTMNHFMYLGGIVGGQARASLMSLIYQKSLKVEPNARYSSSHIPGCDGLESGWTDGRITNLMSTDAFRVEQASMLLHMAWTAPVTIIIALIFLILSMGASALPGSAVLCVGIPSLMMFTKSLLPRRRRINKATDNRIMVTQEAFQSMRAVKLGGLEENVLLNTNIARKSEISMIQSLLSFRMAITSTSTSLPILASIFSFLTYSLTHKSFEPATVFATLSYFTVLRMPLNVLPIIAGQVTDAWASLERIESFLRLEDCHRPLINNESLPLLQLNAASFEWPGAASRGRRTSESDVGSSRQPLMTQRFTLENVSIVLGHGKFLGIAGPVASGKTALLNALLGELEPIAGTIIYNTTHVAWCPEQPWLFNASIRDNITFGKQYNEDWYRSVLFACALLPDLQALQHGDRTLVGERGINLSGGQKQRISLARGIYAKPDIIIMDDPMSALDTGTATLVYHRAIRGLLGSTCRVMASHHAGHLQHADEMLFLEAGHLVDRGEFHDAFFQNIDMNADPHILGISSAAHDDVLDQEPDNPEEETQAHKAVKWNVYSHYVASTGSFLNLLPIAALLLLWEGTVIVTGLWLSFWTSQKFDVTQGQRIAIYVGLALAQAASLFLATSTICFLGLSASRALHDTALRRVVNAPMVFFETTPIGRIMNRFSKDVDSMDNALTLGWTNLLITLVSVTGVLVLIIYYLPVFTPIVLPLLIAGIWGAWYYRASARELKRYASTFRSHVFGYFGNLTAGAATVRTYNCVEHFVDAFHEALDNMNSVEYLTLANQRWLTLRLDAVSSALIFVVGCLAVSPKLKISASTTGLLLSYILGVVQQISYSVAQIAEVENDMVSTERLLQFCTDVPQEKTSGNEVAVDENNGKAKKGALELNAIRVRYRPDLPHVLDLALKIPAGQHVAIIGPSGSGKSSLISTLARLVDVSEGSISLDGVNIQDIALRKLRRDITVIPQDVVLFSGTVGSNIYSSEAQQRSDNKTSIQGLHLASAGLQLEDKVESGGANFSTGQRQLIAIARAFVARPKVLVLDESLSGVDHATNIEMQSTILRYFQDSTVLCIAHRLDGIFDYDRVLYIQNGRIAEDGDPKVLIKEDSQFSRLCQEAQVVF